MRLVAPETITFTQSGFCPGCGHGLAVRLIAEVMEEMGLSEKLLAIVDVACGSLNIDSWRFDTIMAAHGRPIATAVGVWYDRWTVRTDLSARADHNLHSERKRSEKSWNAIPCRTGIYRI